MPWSSRRNSDTIYTRGHEQLVRLTFSGAEMTRTPIIANMAMQCGIPASIINASTRSVGEKVYGFMLLEIPGGPDELARAVKFLSDLPGVTVQVEVEYETKEGEA